MVTLLCTVRTCHAPLARDERAWRCERGHSFDVARSGYVNLLQPQDRRSAQPGDTPEAVAARRRFLDSGVTQPLTDAVVAMLDVSDGAILDAGCGEGHDLAAVTKARSVEGHGVDISVAAIEAASRRHPSLDWVVANADRFLPYADASFAAVMSITARMNPQEFRRVLQPGAPLLVAIPSPDDLLELRTAILGESEARDRVERTRALFANHFTLERHERVQHTVRLDHAAIVDVMTSSYRGLRKRERERMESVDGIEVTLGRDLLLFR